MATVLHRGQFARRRLPAVTFSGPVLSQMKRLAERLVSRQLRERHARRLLELDTRLLQDAGFCKADILRVMADPEGFENAARMKNWAARPSSRLIADQI